MGMEWGQYWFTDMHCFAFALHNNKHQDEVLRICPTLRRDQRILSNRRTCVTASRRSAC
jgi:hypothetical protein